jgi:hypothetical protein
MLSPRIEHFLLRRALDVEAVLSAEYVLVVARLLTAANANLGELDSLDRSIHGSYLSAWAMLVHLHTRAKISAPVCSLFFKNGLSGTTVNHFSRSYTNLLRAGNPNMVALNTR